MSKIPKIIHYCWFGGNPIPDIAIKCMDSWKKFCSEYEIKEWNESNFDIHCCRYVEEAYKAKKWAFVSDYARFLALYNEGGLYFDTDIEVIKPMDSFLEHRVFMGFGNESLTLPVFGAEKSHPSIKAIIDDYNSKVFIKPDGSYNTTTIERVAANVLQKNFGLNLNGKYQQLKDGIVIYPKSYFFTTDWKTGIVKITKDTQVIHYAEGSWLPEDVRSSIMIQRKLVKLIGKKLSEKVGTFAYLFKHYGLKGFIKKLGGKILYHYSHIYMKICWLKKINDNKIIFDNFEGKGYGGNPKYIAEELIRRNLDLDIVWIVKSDCKYIFPKEIRTVEIGTAKYYRELATAKVWVDNVRKDFHIRKRKRQYYIQTWHGLVPFKKIEKDTQSTLSDNYIKCAKNDSHMADIITSGCRERTTLIRRAFWYDGVIIEKGSPRSDIFFKHNSCKEKVYNKLCIGLDKKIVLYVPTFRDSHTTDMLNIDPLRVCEALTSKFGGEFVCVVRLHPAMRDMCANFSYNENCINASYYDDVQELLSVAEILISDYSDCMFEFSLMKRPVFIYAEDIKHYTGERNFYRDFRSLPFDLAENNDELVNSIMQFNEEKYLLKMNKFLNDLGLFEKGNASEVIVDLIVDQLKKYKGKSYSFQLDG